MNKKIFKYDDVKEKIREGIKAMNPVVQTLSPKGSNVLYENHHGEYILTNDGITIAKEISVEDRLVNSVVEIIKGASLKTNQEAGDGTTTTVVICQVLGNEVMKLLEEGMSWIEIRNKLDSVKARLSERLDKLKIVVKNDADLRNVAMISANNDPEIAEKVLEVVKTAGENGMVFLEPNNKSETELLKDLGFMLKQGIVFPELINGPRPTITEKDIPVLLTDKRIYYAEEAEAILRVAIEAGYESIAIVARDFIGEAAPVFIANHNKNIRVVLIKDPKCTEADNSSMEDLALYVGGKIVTEKTGNLVNNITLKDFVFVKQIYQDPQKTLITPGVSASKALKERIKYVREELDKDKDNPSLKERLSSLTDGVVTIKIGGATGLEIREKMFRYEDAVNATRSAMKHGYLIGGGVSLLNSFSEADFKDSTERELARKVSESVIRQIARNCGQHEDYVIAKIKDGKTKTFGYNALNNSFEDLLKAGVIDPFMVPKLAVENAVSAANSLASIKYFLINDIEDGKEE